jgi:hypothetical protein
LVAPPLACTSNHLHLGALLALLQILNHGKPNGLALSNAAEYFGEVVAPYYFFKIE